MPQLSYLGSGRIAAGASRQWQIRVGLEVHAQVLAPRKLFSPASALAEHSLSAPPNSHVALVDCALPGSLPRASATCVEQAVRTAISLQSEVQPVSRFDRKHYFYADLPLGYQITQADMPIAVGGKLRVDAPVVDAAGRRSRAVERTEVGIDRIQLEQDSGKSTHTLLPADSVIDLNRAGKALMEIVTRPEITSPELAGAFLRKLQAQLRHIGTCDGNMEAGSMRCDVNVSVEPAAGSEAAAFPAGWGERVEMKNVSSVRAVTRGVLHEATRQVGLLETGQPVERATRNYDVLSDRSVHLRSKEDAPDYRFLPDPDLAPLLVSAVACERAAVSLPEPLDEQQDRVERRGVERADAAALVRTPGGVAFFDTAVASVAGSKGAVKAVTSLFLVELMGRLRAANLDLADSPVDPGRLAGLARLLASGQIGSRAGKQVLDLWMDGEAGDAESVAAREGWMQVDDAGALRPQVEESLRALPDFDSARDAYRAGNKRVLQKFMGSVMKATRGAANPKTARELIDEILLAPDEDK